MMRDKNLKLYDQNNIDKYTQNISEETFKQLSRHYGLQPNFSDLIYLFLSESYIGAVPQPHASCLFQENKDPNKQQIRYFMRYSVKESRIVVMYEDPTSPLNYTQKTIIKSLHDIAKLIRYDEWKFFINEAGFAESKKKNYTICTNLASKASIVESTHLSFKKDYIRIRKLSNHVASKHTYSGDK